MNIITSTGGSDPVRLVPRPLHTTAWVLVCVAMLGWSALSARAATTNVTRKPQPARWLLIVDTSEKMGDRSKALAGVVGELLVTGVNGQLQDGDQIGLWTFGKELNAGVVPLQTWQPGQSNAIAGRTAQFIAGQKYSGKSKLSVVVPELARVSKDSRQLTVLIFSEPSQTVSGTPYDEELNAAYAAQKAERSQTRMPLVTVLRSEKGKLIGKSVSYAPWLEYPAFTPEPNEPKPAKPSATKAQPAAEPRKSIIIGNEAKPVQPATNVLVVSTPQPVPPVVETPATTIPDVKPVEPVEPPVSPAPPAAPTPSSAGSPPAKQSATPAAIVETPEPATATESATSVVASEPAVSGQPTAEGGILSRKWLLILGLGCMWIAIVMALLLARRSKRSARASLITRSFDRNQR